MAFLTVQIDTEGLEKNSPLLRILKNMNSVVKGGGLAATRLIRNWIRDLGETRHGSADKLGARSTNHFKASDVAAPVIRDDSATIAVTTPGINRAFHDLYIKPVEAKALAIPLHADAYGIQPRELTDRGEQLFTILRRGEKKGGSRSNILYKQDDDGIVAMYALVGSVTQPQDRSLLPSDEDLLGSFSEGAEKAVKTILEMP